MDFLELAKTRYSVRKYKDQAVEQEKLDKILEAGRVAPTAVNNQPQIIYVAKSKDALEKLAKHSPCTFDAPIVFICCYDRNKESYNPDTESHNGAIDIDIVQTQMMLEATELGLGTCWVKRFDPAGVRAEFDIPKNIKIVSLMPCGYPADDSVPSPRHLDLRPASETIFEL